MPHSRDDHITEILDYFSREISQKERKGRILDAGAGAGKFGPLLRGRGFHVEALEIHMPYVLDFHLEDKYDRVIIGDLRELTAEDFARYDGVLLGDIVEHLEVHEAQEVLRRACKGCAKVVFVVPYEYEQGAVDGVEWEIHRQPDLTPALVRERYPLFVPVIENERCGTYAKPWIAAATATAFRPEVLAGTMRALDAVDGIADVPLFVRADPTPRTPEIVALLSERAVRHETRVTVGDTLLGPHVNTRAALRAPFDFGFDAALCIEEDVEVSPDVLRLARWFLSLPNVDDYACLTLFNYSDGDDPGVLREGLATRDDVAEFCPLGFVVTRRSWYENFEAHWADDPRGWDWSIGSHFLRVGARVLRPDVRRSLHTGTVGVNCTADFQERVFAHMKKWEGLDALWYHIEGAE